MPIDTERAYLPLPQVRRADRQTALALLGSAQLLKVLGSGEGGATPTGAQLHFDVPSPGKRSTALPTVVLPPSRTRYPAARSGSGMNSSRSWKKRPNPRREPPLAARWPRRREFLDRLVAQVRHFQRIPPLADVKRREISAAGLNAVSADPRIQTPTDRVGGFCGVASKVRRRLNACGYLQRGRSTNDGVSFSSAMQYGRSNRNIAGSTCEPTSGSRRRR